MAKQATGAAEHSNASSSSLAVVGISCRFPGGCDSPEAFWDFLKKGVDATSGVPSDRCVFLICFFLSCRLLECLESTAGEYRLSHSSSSEREQSMRTCMSHDTEDIRVCR